MHNSALSINRRTESPPSSCKSVWFSTRLPDPILYPDLAAPVSAVPTRSLHPLLGAFFLDLTGFYFGSYQIQAHHGFIDDNAYSDKDIAKYEGRDYG
jgi:hypothetical protein